MVWSIVWALCACVLSHHAESRTVEERCLLACLLEFAGKILPLFKIKSLV